MANKGFLLVLTQPPPAFEEEFNAWYDSEHLAERLAVPGFLTALRFVCLDGHPRYLAMYDLESFSVLEQPAYLKVAYDQSSPWTKRVTSRVRIHRAAGHQAHPGTLVTQRCARLYLLRFRGLGPDAREPILAGLRANFDDQAETIQWRLLANDASHEAGQDADKAGTDYLGLVEARGPLARNIDTRAFGRAADALDLANVYAPY